MPQLRSGVGDKWEREKRKSQGGKKNQHCELGNHNDCHHAYSHFDGWSIPKFLTLWDFHCSRRHRRFSFCSPHKRSWSTRILATMAALLQQVPCNSVSCRSQHLLLRLRLSKEREPFIIIMWQGSCLLIHRPSFVFPRAETWSVTSYLFTHRASM